MTVLGRKIEEIRDDILDKAFARFGRYGFGKTTMAEIAKDCDMSAGNLYRFFKNKDEIGAECCRRSMNEKEKILRKGIDNPEVPSAEKVEEFVLTLLRYMYHLFSAQPLLNDLVNYITTERWDLVQRHMGKMAELLSEILSEGKEKGEFDVEDALQAAQSILAATSKFNTPHFMGTISLEEMETEARSVVKLLLKGLVRS